MAQAITRPLRAAGGDHRLGYPTPIGVSFNITVRAARDGPDDAAEDSTDSDICLVGGTQGSARATAVRD